MAVTQHKDHKFIGGLVSDTDTDLITVKIPLPSQVEVTGISVNTMTSPDASATIELRDSANGAGSSIPVTFTTSDFYKEASGSLLGSVSSYFYIRTVTPGNLNDVNFDILYERTT